MKKIFARRGFLIPLASVLIVVMITLGFSMMTLSRHHLNSIAHFATKEKTYFLAHSVVDIGKSLVDKTSAFLNDSDPDTWPKRDKAPSDIRPIVESMIAPDGNWQINPLELDLSTHPAVVYLKSLDSSIAIELKLTLRDVLPIYNPSAGSLVFLDPLESSFSFGIQASASISDTESNLLSFRQFRLLNILPSVFGKFTLLLKGQPAIGVNPFQDSSDPALLLGSAVQLNSGTSVPSSALLSPSLVRDMLDSHGWVYLGGPEWMMNLAKAGNTKEKQGALIADQTFLYDIPDTQPLAASGNLQYYATQSPLYKELGMIVMQNVLANESNYDKTAIFNLFGSADRPSPTLVLGDVKRRFAILQGINNIDTDKSSPLPYLSESDFSSSSWPGTWDPATITLIRQNFLDSYPEYKKRMSQIVATDYNEGNLGLMDLGMPDLEDAMITQPSVLTTSVNIEPSKKLFAGSQPLPVYKLITPGGSGFVIKDDTSRIMFQGPDLRALDDLSFFVQKSGWIFMDQTAMFKRLKKASTGEIRIAGVVHLKSMDAGFIVSQPLRIASGGGGVIVVDKDIVIRETIQRPDEEPLTLVSLTGDIRVETSSLVQAHLIAMRGKIRVGAAFSLEGGVAAEDWYPEQVNGTGNRSLSYRKIFDPTDSANYKKAYRLMMENLWQTVVQ